MIKKMLLFLVVMLLSVHSGFCQETNTPALVPPLTLEECYKRALKQSELIAIDTEKLKEAQAHFLQALGTILPQASFARSERWQDVSAPAKERGFEQGFVFKQQLFSGFREFAAIAGSHLEKKQFEQQRLRAQQLLFVDVSDAFYFLLQMRGDLAALETIHAALSDRINELKTRRQLGKSRASEVASTETQLYTNEADIQLGVSMEILARELLEFLIGGPAGELIDPETDFVLKSESDYAREASQRPDVLAADYAWQTDKKKVTVARSGFFPSLGLESDYYSHRYPGSADNDWTTFLTLDVPIFDGTTTIGNVREAASLARQSELLFQRSARVARQNAQDAYTNLQAVLAQRVALRKALDSAELNYGLQMDDYKMNVVNNLDVLAALQTLQAARRSFNIVEYAGKRFYWRLLAAAGEINVDGQQ